MVSLVLMKLIMLEEKTFANDFKKMEGCRRVYKILLTLSQVQYM